MMAFYSYMRQTQITQDQEAGSSKLLYREIHLLRLLEYYALAKYILNSLWLNWQDMDQKSVAVPSDVKTKGSEPVNNFVYASCYV